MVPPTAASGGGGVTPTPCLAREDLDGIRSRQERLKVSMRTYNVRHPADLPLQVILAHRAVRLGGGA